MFFTWATISAGSGLSSAVCHACTIASSSSRLSCASRMNSRSPAASSRGPRPAWRWRPAGPSAAPAAGQDARLRTEGEDCEDGGEDRADREDRGGDGGEESSAEERHGGRLRIRPVDHQPATSGLCRTGHSVCGSPRQPSQCRPTLNLPSARLAVAHGAGRGRHRREGNTETVVPCAVGDRRWSLD